MLTFGRIPRQKSGEKFEAGVSDDKRALTLTFSGLRVHAGGSKPKASMSTRLFTLVLPLQGDEPKAEIEFSLDCFVIATGDATASLVCSVNGQSTVADFPKNTDQSFVHTIRFAAETPSEARLCVFLLVGRDSKNANAEAELSVSTIDVELLPRPPGPSE